MKKSKRITLAQQRTLGELISDGLRYCTRNFSALFTGFMVMVVPIVFLGALAIYLIGGGPFDMVNISGAGTDYYIGLTVYYICIAAASIALLIVIYSSILAYEKSEKEKLEFSDIIVEMKLKGWTIGITLIASAVALIAVPFLIGIVAYATDSIWLLVFLVPVIFIFVYYSIHIILMPFIAAKEDKNISESYSRAKELLHENWWSAFGTYLISSLLASVISYIIIIPATVLQTFMSISSIDSGEMLSRSWTSSLMFITSIVTIFVSSYYMTCMVLKYFDLIEREEGNQLRQKVMQIGKKQDSIFENVGDF